MTGTTSDDVGEDTAELARLRAEVERLRELIGPVEKSYIELQVDLLGARDAAIGAEAALGVARGYNAALEAEVERLQRDFRWLRDNVVQRIRRLRSHNPVTNNPFTRLGG